MTTDTTDAMAQLAVTGRLPPPLTSLRPLQLLPLYLRRGLP
jgi:hypothetical protein